jgi:phosphohistidine phosphatase
VPEIVLLRHGKSDWDSDFGFDSERPLSPRGVRAAQTMGRVLSGAMKHPDLVLASPALRALSTAQLAAEAGDWETPIEVVDALYGGGPEAVVYALRGVPPDVGRVLLVGHEPTWSETTSMLVGGGAHRIPTGAAAGLESFVPWPQIEPGACRLLWLLPPRLFTDGLLDV